MNLTLVGGAKDGNGSVQCHTDLSTCCHADDGPHRGDWYFSNGTQLPLPSINNLYSTFVKLSKLICDTKEEVVSHVVYIVALLRPTQSMMMLVGRLCMQECMPVEVRRI